MGPHPLGDFAGRSRCRHINQILSLQNDELQANDPAEAAAILFGQRYAEQLDRIDPDALKLLGSHFSESEIREILGYVYFITFTNLSGNTVDAVLERVLGGGRPITVVEGVAGVGLSPVLALLILLVKLGKLVGADKRRAKRNRVASQAPTGRASKRASPNAGEPQGARSTHTDDPRSREVIPMSLRKLKAKHDEKMKSKLPAEEVLKLIRDGALVVDVRSRIEAAIGTVPGAINVPLFSLKRRMNELPRDRNIVLFCGTGARAGKAKEVLDAEGFKAFNGGGYKGVAKIVRELAA